LAAGRDPPGLALHPAPEPPPVPGEWGRGRNMVAGGDGPTDNLFAINWDSQERVSNPGTPQEILQIDWNVTEPPRHSDLGGGGVPEFTTLEDPRTELPPRKHSRPEPSETDSAEFPKSQRLGDDEPVEGVMQETTPENVGGLPPVYDDFG